MMQVVRAYDFDAFRAHARRLVSAHVKPAELSWESEAAQGSLFEGEAAPVVPEPNNAPEFRVPRLFMDRARHAVLIREPDRFALAYRVLYRLTHGEPRLMEDEADRDLRALVLRAQHVRKDEDRMHAFVRFRQTERDGEPVYAAWYAPAHHVVRLTAPFFARRFASQRWIIFTPDESSSWDLRALHYGPGAPRESAPDGDELEAMFRVYYAATFNPARTNPALFQRHIPAEFQRHLPELHELSALVRAKAPTAAPAQPLSSAPTLEALARELPSCRACPLHAPATQVVPGTGPQSAAMFLIGEQPGDEEDLRGVPFVGPAGAVLDRALADAGIARAGLYISNAVKHFSYRPVGKRRLHMKPAWSAVEACRPWLEAELELVEPKVIVCLGATAAQSFFGRRFTLTPNLGRSFETRWSKALIVTYHPSAILRAVDQAEQRAKYDTLVRDLARAAALVASTAADHVER